MFDNETLYLPTDPEIQRLGSYSTLASWRSEGRGPRYVKIGGRVMYRGRDLNEWIEAQTVDPANRTAA